MPSIAGLASALLPSRGSDGVARAARLSPYADFFSLSSLNPPEVSALEGSHFHALPTPAAAGTGTAIAIQTTFSETVSIFELVNTDANKYAALDYLRLRVTAAGATTTSSEIAFAVDTTNRHSSGGSTMTAYKSNPNASAPASICTPRMGALVSSAASANRQWVGHTLIKVAAAPAFIVNDVFIFSFGSQSIWLPGNSAGPLATTVSQYTFPFGPCVVPPGGTFLAHMANVANATTAPSFEFEAGWYER